MELVWTTAGTNPPNNFEKPEHSPQYWVDAGVDARKSWAYNTEDPATLRAIVQAELFTNINHTVLQNIDQEFADELTIALVEAVVGKGWGWDDGDG